MKVHATLALVSLLASYLGLLIIGVLVKAHAGAAGLRFRRRVLSEIEDGSLDLDHDLVHHLEQVVVSICMESFATTFYIALPLLFLCSYLLGLHLVRCGRSQSGRILKPAGLKDSSVSN